MPSPDIAGTHRGYVIPIGGAEDKLHNPEILQKFVELAGGADAVITVIPTASQLDDTGDRYQTLFNELGAGTTHVLPITERSDAQKQEYVEILEQSTAIFVTGGNQLRLSTILGGTPIAKAIRQLNAQGVHYAGTSAGAAIVSQHMITAGSTGIVPTENGVSLAPGLGLVNTAVIDQHFNQRNRLARLLSAVSYNPFLIGLGLDEDTAAFINENNEFTVVGSGAITVIDPSNIEYSSMAEANRGEALTLLNLKVHILSAGSRFDLNSKQAYVK
ncbi:cyanophycinase [Paraglaciecola polaris]|uniref:Cyanophycinase n=1 Tax=Paraglaciecola polaris LMG 21857 TaxID=1129793 RepID=K6ZLY1_9ALTE|nr:cyanophycinase [Paraglaciecola polaris]GAC31307.1 cyanophycinase [Paraglaciecola polaris LMG 21857]|tara:strand:+ start:2872 stop:3690 length:819 start_codon:yes stop_codon:yes gene_type:complete